MSRYESPEYDVIRQEGSFELRRYAAFATSTVETTDFRGRDGFGTLFNYISGKNAPAVKMAMTVPVINTFEEKGMTMEFVVPSKHVQNGVPEPLDARIKRTDYPKHLAAVVRFSGAIKIDHLDVVKTQLVEWLEAQQLETVGPFRLARYNSPFSIPMMRRNELWIEVIKRHP